MRIHPQALILDLDGVLADTEPLHERAWDTILAHIPAGRLAEERNRLIGMSAVAIAKELAALFGITMSIDEMLAEKRRRFQELVREDLAPFEGLAEELEHWKGTPIGVATSSARVDAEATLKRLQLPVTFSAIVTCDDVPRAKPAPDCYLLAAKLLKKRPEDCAAVEDSVHGIRAAAAAGLRVMAVSTQPLETLPEGTERVFPTTVEALRWLRNGSDGKR